MFIKHIKIEQFGNIDCFEMRFDSKLNFLSGKKASYVMQALGVVLKIKNLEDKIKKSDIRDETFIEADVASHGNVYKVTAMGNPKNNTFSYMITGKNGEKAADSYSIFEKNREEKNLSWYCYKKTDLFSKRFKQYKNPEDYYKKGEFTELTNGIGDTATFRACLRKYFYESCRENHAKSLIADINHYINEKDNGEYSQECTAEKNKNTEQQKNSSQKNTSQENSLQGKKWFSLSDKIIFEYLCFLKINEFWKEIEDIRDMHHEEMPFLIEDLAEKTDESVDMASLIREAEKQKRQIIMSIV